MEKWLFKELKISCCYYCFRERLHVSIYTYSLFCLSTFSKCVISLKKKKRRKKKLLYILDHDVDSWSAETLRDFGFGTGTGQVNVSETMKLIPINVSLRRILLDFQWSIDDFEVNWKLKFSRVNNLNILQYFIKRIRF